MVFGVVVLCCGLCDVRCVLLLCVVGLCLWIVVRYILFVVSWSMFIVLLVVRCLLFVCCLLCTGICCSLFVYCFRFVDECLVVVVVCACSSSVVV